MIRVAAQAGPAVVTITTSVNQGPFGLQASAVGSGVIFDASGLILTNNHVVAGADSLSVRLADGRSLPGTVIRSSSALDLAVVQIKATGLAVVAIGSSSDLHVGQLVVAIGSPEGLFTNSVTFGILSGQGRSITVRDELTGRPRRLTNLLQTDAAINPGNSGGPLLDRLGRIIGINTAIDPNAAGLGFAVPIDTARAIMRGTNS